MKGPNYFNIMFADNNFLDLRLYQYGWEDCLPLHSFGPAVREHFLFHYITSGSGTLFCRGSDGKEYKYSIHANQGFLLYPEQVSTYIADEQQPWKYIWLEFDGLRAEEAILNAGFRPEQPVYQPKNIAQGKRLWEMMLHITANEAASPLHILGHLYLFLDQLIESSANQRERSEKQVRDFYIQEAIGYIQENYRRNLTVDEVVKFCKVNHNQFTRRFKRIIGCTPQEYLIRIRLTTAADLLRDTPAPIKEIAADCGYSNPLHFSQAFKRFYGISPREWRKNNCSENIRWRPQKNTDTQ